MTNATESAPTTQPAPASAEGAPLTFNGIASPNGQVITFKDGKPQTPDQPVIPFIEGDGIGAEIWSVCRSVLDNAVASAYGGKRKIAWLEVFAGEKARQKFGDSLPQDTLRALRHFGVGIKGPLNTPTGGGFRSLNVAMRQTFDLYQCVRPVRYFNGVPSVVKRPQDLDVVIFRENTEDVYAGIEYKIDSPEAKRILKLLEELGNKMDEDTGVGIKIMSRSGSRRLVRSAIEYAIKTGRKTVTMVHKGNIQKFTEGAFRDWGYELGREEFADKIVTEADLWSKHNGVLPEGKILLNDRIADAMFFEVLTKPDKFSVIATMNLNGDYLSDACAAQVGGLGIAPGANIGDNSAIFEATHGTAPDIAGKNLANPCSLILSGVMMLEYLGWQEAAKLVVETVEKTIAARTVTGDLARFMADATALSTSDFGAALIANMPQGDHKTGNEPQAATKPEPRPEEAEKIDDPQSPEPTAA
ncbi:MAG: isocitrate dehydrogenase (NADP(+)) [Candidatus Obscuribacter phosphatis]|uniref:Isocitrate dehydrogenase [NADP] n=1 Tax=Candidatus Obscuribacter phosphatis TaxID=1906157 RepID=A0A8J7PF74_9BACT|nr:isocitrate dehydrogenase (NADP(+)) [Candidatus Obscuribacter phosphatis]